MKIIKLLYQKYFLSFSICLFSCFVIFFIFSLVSYLTEDYSFYIIINLSFLNSLQIFFYVPSFIFLISVILFTIFLRSRNEIVIIKSYLNINKVMIFFIPVVIIYTVIEINKKDMINYLENNKSDLLNLNKKSQAKILIDMGENNKKYTIIKNLDLKNFNNTEYRSYFISDKKIETAEFSDNLMTFKNELMLKNFTQYKNNIIKDIIIPKKINPDIIELTNQNSIVKNIYKENIFKLDIKLLNLMLFYALFLGYIFLKFFNSKFVSTKQSLKNPVFINLILLIYSFLIFNNSIGLHKQEFELLASMVMSLFFLKAYLNE